MITIHNIDETLLFYGSLGAEQKEIDRNLCAAHGAEQPGHDPGTGSGDDAPVLSPPQALEMTKKLRPGTP